jgi:hypothetical protein
MRAGKAKEGDADDNALPLVDVVVVNPDVNRVTARVSHRLTVHM